MADPTKARLRPALRIGGVFGFIGGFLLAYQRSSCEFYAMRFVSVPAEITLMLSMLPSQSASGAGQRISTRRKETLPS